MSPSKNLVCLLAAAALSLGVTHGLSASQSPKIAPWGVNLDYIDRDQKPGQDFFTYANGGWLKTATIPPDRPAAGAGLEISIQNEGRLKEIVADLHARPNLTPEETKLRDFYDAFMDEAQIEAQGLKPAAKDLEGAYAQINEIGRATGRPQQAADEVSALRGQVRAALKSVSASGRTLSPYTERISRRWSSSLNPLWKSQRLNRLYR